MIEKTYKDYVRRIKYFASTPELKKTWKDVAEKHNNQIIVEMINDGEEQETIEFVKLMYDKLLENELKGEPMPKVLWEETNKKQKN